PDGGVMLTGRLTASAHSWLADHAIHGTVLLPGTALVELALYAGGRVGCPGLDELTLAAPLVLPAGDEVRPLSVTVGPPDGRDRVAGADPAPGRRRGHDRARRLRRYRPAGAHPRLAGLPASLRRAARPRQPIPVRHRVAPPARRRAGRRTGSGARAGVREPG